MTNSQFSDLSFNYHNSYKLYDGNFPDSWEAKVIGIMIKNDPSTRYPGFKVDGMEDMMTMSKDNEYWVVSDTYDGSGFGEYNDYVSTPNSYQDDFYLIIQHEP